jgi:hypothetical protein
VLEFDSNSCSVLDLLIMLLNYVFFVVFGFV